MIISEPVGPRTPDKKPLVTANSFPDNHVVQMIGAADDARFQGQVQGNFYHIAGRQGVGLSLDLPRLLGKQQ